MKSDNQRNEHAVAHVHGLGLGQTECCVTLKHGGKSKAHNSTRVLIAKHLKTKSDIRRNEK